MTNPFFDGLGSKDSQQGNPFFDGVNYNDLRLETAKGRLYSTQENINSNIEKLKKIKPRDDVQKKRIEKLLASFEMQKSGGSPRPGANPQAVGGATAGLNVEIPSTEEFARGAATGVETAFPWLKDLALTIPSFFSDKAKAARSNTQEQIMSTREELDPRGTTGAIGEFAGGAAALQSPLNAFSKVTGLARILAGPKASASVIARIAAHIAEQAPLNVTQALSLPEGTPVEERLKILGITSAAAGLGGLARGEAPVKNGAKPMTPGNGLPVESAPGIDEKLQATLGKIDEAKAVAEAKKQQVTQARAEWQAKNPGKKWADLDKEQRKTIINAFNTEIPSQGNAIIDPETGEQGLGPTGSAPLPPKPPVSPSVAGGGKVEAPVATALGGVEGKAPVAPESPEFGGKIDPAAAEYHWDRLSRSSREKLLRDAGSDAETARIYAGERWKSIPEAHKDIIEVMNGRPPRDAEAALDKFEQNLRGVVEPQKRLDPIEQKLKDLKDKMSRGEAPKAPQKPPMTPEELEKGVLGKSYDEDIENFVGRLGAARALEVQKNLQSELDGLTPDMSKIKMIDDQVDRIKRSASVWNTTPSKIDKAFQEKKWVPVEEAKATKAKAETLRSNETQAITTMAEFPSQAQKYINVIADLTGETPEQVRTRLDKEVPKYFDAEIEKYNNYLNDPDMKSSKDTWVKAIERMEGKRAEYLKSKKASGLLGDLKNLAPNEIRLPPTNDEKVDTAKWWNALSEHERVRIMSGATGKFGELRSEVQDALTRFHKYKEPIDFQKVLGEIHKNMADEFTTGQNVDKGAIELTPPNEGAPESVWANWYNSLNKDQRKTLWRSLGESSEQELEFLSDPNKDWHYFSPDDRKFLQRASKNDIVELPDEGDPMPQQWLKDAHKKNFKEWWNKLGYETKQDDLFGSGLVRAKEIDGYLEMDDPNKFPDFLKKHLEDLYNQDVEHNNKPHVQEWNAMPDKDKTAFVNEWNKSKGIPKLPDDYEWDTPWRALDPEFQKFVEEKIMPGSRSVPSMDDLGIKVEKGQTAEEWWKGNSYNQREALLHDFLGETGIGMDDDSVSRLVNSRWNQMTPEFQSQFQDWFSKYSIGGKTGLNVGREFYEPSAAERLARTKLPDDMKTPLMDLLIDSHVDGWDDATLAKKLDDFAAQNELTPEQVRAGAKELGHELPGPEGEPAAGRTAKEFWENVQDDVKESVLGIDPKKSWDKLSKVEKAKVETLWDGLNSGTKVDVTGKGQPFGKIGEVLDTPLEASPGTPAPEPSITEQPPLSPTDQPSTIPPQQQAQLYRSIRKQRIAALTDAEIDSMKEALFKKLEANPNDKDAMEILHQLADETQSRSTKKNINEEATRYLDNQIVQKLNTPKLTETPRMDPKEYVKLARTSPRKLSSQDLDRLIDETGYHISGLTDIERKSSEYTKLMDKLLAEKAERNRPGPLDAQIPPPVFGAAVGFTYGMYTSKDEDRATNALMWAAIGAGGAYGLQKIFSRVKPTIRESSPELFPGQHKLPNIVSYLDERSPYTIPWLTRLRKFYAGTVRSTAEMEYLYEKGGGHNLPVYYSAAKRAAIFGRWLGKAEYALTRGPVLEVNGEPVSLGAVPPFKIKDIAGGDISNLDELSIARTVLEQMTKAPNKSYPMDQMRAVLTVKNASPELHTAADALRELNLAGVKIAADGGLVAVENIPKMASETWYASLRRVFGANVSRKDLRNIITSPQPIKGRLEGSSLQVKSPYESSIEMLPKVIRAAEYNKIKQQFITFVKTLPKDIQGNILTRVQNKGAKTTEFYNDQIAALQALMPEMTAEDAGRITVAMSEEITNANPHMTVYENGVLRTYRLDQGIFDAFKAMTPTEQSGFVGLVGGANRAASKGIVQHPWFIGMQSMLVEPLQAGLQSQYGFVPYVDNIRGWWNIVSDSPQYRKILAEGGVGSIQSLPYATAAGAIKQSKVTGNTPLERAVGQLKEFHPFEAWKALTTPFAEAARMGEALRALAHGESTLEAAYAAWHLLGNTRMEGNFAGMRAFNLMTLFSRPAISALDELVTKAGVNPFRQPRTSQSQFASIARTLGLSSERAISGAEFALKGFAYISLPSMYLWYKNKDDAEITQLRQTEGGQRYWFFRTPDGSIGKVRKPHVIGQMFGSTVEEILDKQSGMDPSGESLRWLDGLANDAAFNMLPQFGVIPASLLANKVWGFGSPIVSDPAMETQMTGEDQSSNPARVVANVLAPVANQLDPQGFWSGALRRAMTPQGFDFIVNNVAGILGQDALKTVDAAMNTREFGLTPSKDELPIVGKLFARYPSMNTRNVRDFYNKAIRVEIVTNSLHEILASKPQFAAPYIEDHQNELALAPVYSQTRQQVANLNRAIMEMKHLLSRNEITAEEYRKFEKQMLETIINVTGEINRLQLPATQTPVQR